MTQSGLTEEGEPLSTFSFIDSFTTSKTLEYNRPFADGQSNKVNDDAHYKQVITYIVCPDDAITNFNDTIIYWGVLSFISETPSANYMILSIKYR